jgi:hypothetical protein
MARADAPQQAASLPWSARVFTGNATGFVTT